ncbi:MAG: alpha-galactosidase [Steroidobacteraceae bacterium]
MPKRPDRIRLDTAAATLVFDLAQGCAALTYAGARLPLTCDLADLGRLGERAVAPNQPDQPQPASILPNPTRGNAGSPPILMWLENQPCALDLQLAAVQADVSEATLQFADELAGVHLQSRWRSLPAGLFEVRQSLTLTGHEAILLACASLSLPLPAWATHLRHFSGRWAREMRSTVTCLTRGPSVSGSSQGGRSGFGGGQWLLIEEQDTGEHHGRCLGLHLAWSGDYEWRIERADNGRLQVTLGARLDPGEIRLGTDRGFDAPPALLAFSSAGRSGLAQLFHRHVQEGVLPTSTRGKPRKVHLNTWEACGFGQSPARLEGLVEEAASLGVERFVLDDGWFGSREDDRSSLGDWQPRPDVFPHGLGPFAERVRSRGMDLGLWVEPEMVSPDSDLYRLHPDWCLHVPGAERATQRHQLVLDLTRAEVADDLFRKLDQLVSEADLAYLKWDHNRPLFPRAGRAHAQTLALYALLDRLRARHPALDIETCASGGGRVDYALLSRCHRVWPSDNNDPIERLPTLQGWLQFLPLAVCGHHVGPDPNPITGRSVSMHFRSRVAVFGHYGIEADPGTMTAADRAVLAAHIALYKHWRDVLHAGTLHSLGAGQGCYGWLAWHGTRGLALVAQTEYPQDHDAPPLVLRGLDPEARYRVKLPEPWPEPAASRLPHQARWRSGWELPGSVLLNAGLPLPLTHPHTAWLIELERT